MYLNLSCGIGDLSFCVLVVMFAPYVVHMYYDSHNFKFSRFLLPRREHEMKLKTLTNKDGVELDLTRISHAHQ